jgi:hypothetical protein
MLGNCIVLSTISTPFLQDIIVANIEIKVIVAMYFILCLDVYKRCRLHDAGYILKDT